MNRLSAGKASHADHGICSDIIVRRRPVRYNRLCRHVKHVSLHDPLRKEARQSMESIEPVGIVRNTMNRLRTSCPGRYRKQRKRTEKPDRLFPSGHLFPGFPPAGKYRDGIPVFVPARLRQRSSCPLKKNSFSDHAL